MKKRVVLVMKRYVIEPLGVMHLAGIAHKLGWDVKVILYDSKDGKFDFEPLYEEVEKYSPDLVGFSIWTGAHLQSFGAADYIRENFRVRVAIGGPHATYFTEECTRHADMVAKGDGFRIFAHILNGGNLPQGVIEEANRVFFDGTPNVEDFPMPDEGRRVTYERYPELSASPIKSIMCSIGCPFHCSYCNSPFYNEMYGGFKKVFRVRPVDDIIAEARWVLENCPETKMFYFQDDIFGYDLNWLKEFSCRWKREFGDRVKWHCQIRLELTRGKTGLSRLQLFADGGCSGVTLAIESGNDFLREYVLLRPMPHELIVDGCKLIMDFGLTLRTEQILQVPFSNMETDLSTLALNVEINPQMAWSSILAPFGETDMGKIAKRFLFYGGGNDDIVEEFYFDHSQLRHSETGLETMMPIVRNLVEGSSEFQRFNSPLLTMFAKKKCGNRADIFLEKNPLPLCELQYMSSEGNIRYCEQGSRLQRLFNWLAKVPDGHILGKNWVSLRKDEWTFGRLGELTEEHLVGCGYGPKLLGWKCQLAKEMGVCFDGLPKVVKDNPFYFCFFPSGGEFAKRIAESKISELGDWKFFDELGGRARRWLFQRYLYKTHLAVPPIASR